MKAQVTGIYQCTVMDEIPFEEISEILSDTILCYSIG